MKAPCDSFAVGSKAYSFHDWELRQRNIQYLSALQADYFEQVAKPLAIESITPSSALSTRLTYFHAVESFFALLFATLQAPWAIIAWLQLYGIETLRQLVATVTACDRTFQYFRVDLGDCGWRSVSDMVNQFSTTDPDKGTSIRKGFAQLWTDLAAEFATDLHQAEYNQIKHGFRAVQGALGITMRLQTENEHGSLVKEHVLPRAKWGAEFHAVNTITGAPPRHYGLTRHVVNWDMQQMLARLVLLSYSINNVRSFARMLNGIPGSECQFLVPDDAALFKTAHDPTIGVFTATIGRQVNIEDIQDTLEREPLDSYREKIRFIPKEQQ